MMRIELLPALLVALSACTAGTTETAVPAAPSPPLATCDATGLQGHIGHKASAKSGAILLELSGAGLLRWVPPRTAVTMDYRADRLTVSYDDDMVINRISCG